ncbi:MAG: 6-phosphogluconolactonase [Deltaproteobacteria bacterium]
MKWETTYYPALDELSLAAARFIRNLARERIERRGIFTLVLSGGKTPRGLYEILAGPEFQHAMPWSGIHLFWGDERCVPPDHSESNYHMAFEAMISRTEIPPRNIHRIPAEMDPPEAAARQYARILRDFFFTAEEQGMNHARPGTSESLPSFDLILLGMGEDGHTASLFPGAGALDEDTLWVSAVQDPVGSPPVPRITLTLPVINEAQNVLFMVAGPEKWDVLRTIVESPSKAAARYPAARINPRGRLLLFHDCEILG